jgi:hypothetical protein
VSEPRIAPGERRDVGVFTWALSHAAGRVMGAREPLNLFLTLEPEARGFVAHEPDGFRKRTPRQEAGS